MTRLVPSGLSIVLLLALVSGCVPRMTMLTTPTVVVPVGAVEAKPIITTGPEPNNDGRNVGELVEVEWNKSWWNATLVERRGARWLVHYDGYDSDWDEVVTLDRIRDRLRDDGSEEPVLVPMEEDVDP